MFNSNTTFYFFISAIGFALVTLFPSYPSERRILNSLSTAQGPGGQGFLLPGAIYRNLESGFGFQKVLTCAFKPTMSQFQG